LHSFPLEWVECDVDVSWSASFAQSRFFLREVVELQPHAFSFEGLFREFQ
jgi:hypothetical protein